jgi:hypothetical protein
VKVLDQEIGEGWVMYQGDCIPITAGLPSDSMHFCIFSPPFSNLYVYSDSEADMGNCANHEEFFGHFDFLVPELLRVVRPGRLCAVHCKDLPLYMNRDDAAGLYDFPGDLRASFERARTDADAAARWVYHSRVTIWKDPVTEMQRTKNHGLLHKNFSERAEVCRQGMPDYLLVFRKWTDEARMPDKQVRQERRPGDFVGTNPPEHWTDDRDYSIQVWQRYASPVWYDINQMHVLNVQRAREDKDEKHICPLQLDVISRCVDLWTNPGETVYSPFAGIGSEGYQALRMGRRFAGAELKASYWEVACANMKRAIEESRQGSLEALLA